MKAIVLSLAAGFSLLAASASAQTWTLDNSHSGINFSVDHMVVSETEGNFKSFQGTVGGAKDDFSDLSLVVVVDVNSINTNDEKRDGHLKSADFFDAAKYPTIRFQSTGVKKTGPNTYDIAGNLTMKGVTKPVVLKVVHKGTVAKDPYGKTRAGFRGNLVVDRKDYGLTYNSVLDNGGLAIGDEVRITVNAELVK